MFSRGKEDIPEADTSGVGPCECRAAGLAVGMHQRSRRSVSAHQSGESRSGSAPANWNFCLVCKVSQGVGLHLDGPTGQLANQTRQWLLRSLNTRSNVFRISSIGTSEVSGLEQEIICLVDRSTIPVRIIEYREP